mmetsp:Transcript_25155/g.35111  ORF Transcript_25155/g.35111 Transcript_25155/m.35111 type:complete len:489 (+) Transcript_25155:188-1654(+)
MREVVTICIGQGGGQVGKSFWELACLEHGVQNDGTLLDEKCAGIIRTFYSESKEETWEPRTLFVDLDPEPIEALQKSAASILNPASLISGKKSAGHIFSRGRSESVRKEVLNVALDRIRALVDQCECLQSFIILNSLGGGTGSGFGSLLLESLSKNYRKPKIGFHIFPSCAESSSNFCSSSPEFSSSTLESYNAMLHAHTLTDHTDTSVVLGNTAIYDICRSSLGVTRPGYGNLNEIIGQLISASTIGSRFDSAPTVDLSETQTGLVPCPRLHFYLTSFAPITADVALPKAKLNAKVGESICDIPTRVCQLVSDYALYEEPSVLDITKAAFEAGALLVKCDPKNGMYMSCYLMYRGEVSPKDVNEAIKLQKVRDDIKFVDWCPTGMKCGIAGTRMVVTSDGTMVKTKKSVMSLVNSTAVRHVFRRLAESFDVILKKKAFLHSYLAGDIMEENEFIEARENIEDLIRDYEDCELDDDADEDEGGFSDDG